MAYVLADRKKDDFILLDCRLPPKAKLFIRGVEHCRAWERWAWRETLAIPEHERLCGQSICSAAGLAAAGMNLLF